MSDLSQVTIVVTTFLRPASLARCLASLKQWTPECPLIVVNDGYEASGSTIVLPFDSGLPAKRNAAAKACSTKYLLMFCDDFEMDSEGREGVVRLLHTLESDSSIDVAGGRVGQGYPYEGFIEYREGSYIRETRLKVTDPVKPFYDVDIMVNYWMCRPELLRQYPQDERMKIGGEHGDWFLQLKLASRRCVWVPGVVVSCFGGSPDDDKDYAGYRGRCVDLGHRILLDKWNITKYLGFDDERKPENTLIAIVTCAKNSERLRSVQQTWISGLRDRGFQVESFNGDRLQVPDDYVSLPYKTRAIARYAVDQGFGYVLKLDDDTYLRPNKIKNPFVDYAGWVRPAGVEHNWHYCAGAGVWLSNKVLEIIANSPLPVPNESAWINENEDVWIGYLMDKHGIKPQKIESFKLNVDSYKRFLQSPKVSLLMQIRTPEDMLQAWELDNSSDTSKLGPAACPGCKGEDFTHKYGRLHCTKCKKQLPGFYEKDGPLNINVR